MRRNLPPPPRPTCGRNRHRRRESAAAVAERARAPREPAAQIDSGRLDSAAGWAVVVWGVSVCRRGRAYGACASPGDWLYRGMHMSDFDRGLAELASRQHGTFATRQALLLGGTRLMLHGRARAGRIDKVDVDVYRIAGLPPSWESRIMAVALSAGPGALISHRAAAALWGFEGFNRGVPEVTIPRGRKYRRTGVRTHESTDLDRTTPRQRAGIPLTDPSRTLLDLARLHRRPSPPPGGRVRAAIAPDLMARADRHPREARSSWSPRDPPPSAGHRRERPSRRDHRQRLRAARARPPPRARRCQSRSFTTSSAQATVACSPRSIWPTRTSRSPSSSTARSIRPTRSSKGIGRARTRSRSKVGRSFGSPGRPSGTGRRRSSGKSPLRFARRGRRAQLATCDRTRPGRHGSAAGSRVARGTSSKLRPRSTEVVDPGRRLRGVSATYRYGSSVAGSCHQSSGLGVQSGSG